MQSLSDATFWKRACSPAGCLAEPALAIAACKQYNPLPECTTMSASMPAELLLDFDRVQITDPYLQSIAATKSTPT